MRYELELVTNNLELQELTLEASKIASIIDKTFLDLEKALVAKTNGELTTENATSYLKNIASESDIFDYQSELTIENSYNFDYNEHMKNASIRSDAKFIDIITKIFMMIMEAIKKFINIFKQLITKIRIVASGFDKRADDITKVLDEKLDITGSIDITDLDLKQQVFELIGAYALQYNDLTVEAGIATALTSPKDYSKLVTIIEGLGKWNDSLLNENTFNLDDFKEDQDWSKRHEVLLSSWKTNVNNKRVPSSLTKLAENMSGQIFGTQKHVKVLGFGKLGYFENRLGAGNLAFFPYGIDGKTIHVVTAYNQDIGKLMEFKAEVYYDVKDMQVQYPTISLLRKCLKDIVKHDYKSMEKDIVDALKTIEKDFKSKIDEFMKDKLNTDSVKQLHITSMLRGIYGGNINTINSVAMSMVTHTLRNNNNLIKYIDLMTSQLPSKNKDTNSTLQLTS